MKRGDMVYVARFDYDGSVDVASMVVKSAGKRVTVAERCRAIELRLGVPWSWVATSRVEALEALIARVGCEVRAAKARLADAMLRLATASAFLAKAQKEGRDAMTDPNKPDKSVREALATRTQLEHAALDYAGDPSIANECVLQRAATDFARSVLEYNRRRRSKKETTP